MGPGCLTILEVDPWIKGMPRGEPKGGGKVEVEWRDNGPF